MTSRKPKGMIAVCIILAIFITLIGWNLTALEQEKEAHPPQGVRVGVFDTKVSVFTAGERQKGQPAIVFLSGLGTPSPVADFSPLWSRLSRDYYTVVLERPGYGWSSQTQRERTLDNIIEEDRLALDKLGISPPYLFVAHSIGGIEAHYYAANHPGEVAGLVFLDCMSPELMVHYGTQPVPLTDRAIHPLRLFGLLRLFCTAMPNTVEGMLGEDRNGRAFIDDSYKAVEEYAVLKTYQSPSMLEEREYREQNALTASEVALPGDIPAMSIVSMAADVDREDPYYKEYMDYQERWMAQAKDGKILFLEGGHYIHQYKPDEVCMLIRDMMMGA